MALIAINTCGGVCAVLVRTAEGDFEASNTMQTGQDQVLATMAKDMLFAASIKPADLKTIAVAIGPGSFTGVRIGVAFARGLAIATNQTAIGVNLLDVLAVQAKGAGAELGIGVMGVGRGQVSWSAWGPKQLEQPAITCGTEDLQTSVMQRAAGRTWNMINGDEVTLEMWRMADHSLRLTSNTDPANPWYARPPDAKLPGGIDPWA